jgi:hypothetical protein
MIHVELMGHHAHLEVDHRSRPDTAAFYAPWKADEDITEWLNKLPKDTWLISHIVERTYEQGIGEISMFEGLRFTFDKVEDALLFKMTFA